MTGANVNRVRLSVTFKRLGWIAMLGLVLAAPAAQAAVFDIPDGLVEVNPNDGQCSLVEAFENIGAQDQVHDDCPAPDPAGPNTVNLAPSSEYLLQTPGSFGYLDFIQIPVEINGNNASILRPAGGQDTILFESMPDADQAFSLNNVTLDGGDLQAPLIIHGGGALNLTSVNIRNTGMGIEAFVEIPVTVSIGSSRFENVGTGAVVFGSGDTPVTVATTVFDQAQEGIRAVDTTAELDNNLFINGGTGVRLEGTLSSAVIAVNRFENQGLGVDLIGGSLDLSHSGFTGGGTGVQLPMGSSGSASIRNVTFSGQSLGLDAESGSTFVNNVTFASNLQAVTAFLTVQVANSIFADSSTDNCGGTGVVSLGYNLSTDTTCVSEPTDLSETDPLLGQLADNGGPTLTHALQPGSPAISASQNVDTPCEATDQRFVARPQDGNNDANPQCDIGAFELEGNPQPSIELLKSITSGSPYTSAGDVITYEFVATNTGNVTLVNVVIDDPDVAIIECELTQPAVLEPSQSQFCNGSYVITQADVDAGSFTNTATVTGEYVFGTPVFDQDSATAEGPDIAPAISLTKSITSGSPYAAAGDVISYSLVATNTGNVELTQVTISDPRLGALACNPTQPATRQPGESLNCTGSYTVTQADVDAGSVSNTATASGRDPDNNLITAQATATAQGPAPAPTIRMAKSITSGERYTGSGDVIEYLLEMTNTGNLTLTQAFINDPDLELLDCGGQSTIQAAPAPPPAASRRSRLRAMARSDTQRVQRNLALQRPEGASPAVTLLPGESFACSGEYAVTEADVAAGSFTNTATAAALTPAGAVVSDQDSATAIGPLLLIPAEADLGVIDIGETFNFTVTAVGGLPPYAFAIGSLPEGASSATTAAGVIISGTGLRAGRLQFPITVRDSSQPPDQLQRTYLLRVATDLEITPDTLPDGVQGVDYFQALGVANGIPPYTFQADTLPPGISLQRHVLSGTPTEAGTFEFSVIAIDAQDNVGEAVYTLTIGPPDFGATNLELPDGVVNVSYSHQLFANSPANPVVWSDAQGLPPGLELQYTGFIAGTPTQAGSFQITARATNDVGQTIDASAPLVVLERGVINATPALPPGVAGRAYTGPLTIFGSDPPFDCGVTSGALPDGLALADCDPGITGIPGVPGSFGFELLVTDGATPPASDRGPFTIRIADPGALDEVPGLVGAPTVTVAVPDFGRGRPSPDLPDESLQQMAIDGFGNRYLVGYSYNGNDYDLLVLKFDADGKPLWSQRFDSGDHDFGYGIAVNPIDQGIYVAGYLLNGNRYEGVLLSFDAAGVLRWEQRTTGGVLADALYGVAADRDGVYVTGERYNGNNFDAIYAGFSHQGIPRWIQLRTTAPTQTGYVVNTNDCSLPPCPLLVGGSEGASLTDGWLLAVDRASGAVTAGQSLSQTGILAAAGTSDGWVIGGDTPDGKWRITRITRDLQSVWSTTFTDGERLRGMVADEADFIYAAGRTGTGENALLTLLTPEGQVIQSRPFDTGARDQFNGVGIGPEGLLTAAGERREPGGRRAILFYLDTGKGL